MQIRNIKVVERIFSYDDVPFITESWLYSARRTPYMRDLTNRTYFQIIPKMIADIIQDVNTRIKIYCNQDDHTHIIGFLIYDLKDKRIHYAYTAPSYRRAKVASTMIEEAFKTTSDNLYSSFTVVFNPFQFKPKDNYL